MASYQSLNKYDTNYIFTLSDNDFKYLWDNLRNQNPQEICANSLAEYIEEGIFSLKMLGADYLLDIRTQTVYGPKNRLPPEKRAILSLAHYLNGASPKSFSYNLVPEKVLPGGDRFFSGTHALKREPILVKFSSNGDAFISAAKKIGADIISDGPYNFIFLIKLLPKIITQVNLAVEDEEFPAQVNFAFDDSVAEHLSLGVLASLCAILNDELCAKATEISK